MERVIRWNSQLCGVVEKLCSYLVISLMLSMVSVVGMGVIFRFVLNNSLSWSEEIAKFLLVWLSFIGAAVAVRRGAHIAITVLTDKFRGTVKTCSEIVIWMVVIIACYDLLYYGWQFALNAKIQSAATISVSMFWVMVSVPISGGIMLLFASEHLLQALVTLFKSTIRE